MSKRALSIALKTFSFFKSGKLALFSSSLKNRSMYFLVIALSAIARAINVPVFFLELVGKIISYQIHFMVINFSFK